jgi:energy-coupling factor transporter ATP-binding protein EcfA2
VDLFNLKRKRRDKLLAAWGKRKPFRQNQFYEEQLFEQKSYEFAIDEQTAEDLDFDRLFNFVDRTSSVIGQQCLYERLRKGTASEDERMQLEKAIDYYADTDKGEIVELLTSFKQSKDYIYPTMFFGEVPKVTKYRGLIRLLQLVAFACLLFGITYPVLWVAFIPFLAINLYIHYRIKQQMGLFIDVFSRLSKLYTVGRDLIPLSHHQFGLDAVALASKTKRLKKYVRSLKFLSIDDRMAKTEGANVMAYVMEVVKFATLLDVVTYYALLDSLPEIRESAESIYYAIGEVDIALSVLALRGSLAYFAKPDLSGTHRLRVSELYHPLIDEPVANDLELDASGMLVTGSNMSGKSTFIKTLNINAICAQTLNTAFARDYASRTWRVASSMNTSDQLAEGSSYYLKEVERIKALLDFSEETATPYLITIDEVFRGTNTVERVSSAKAVLDHLAKGDCLVLVSTHDLELADLLADHYAFYYFQEAVVDQALSFDYKLKHGIMTERNAIKILALTGYPEEVVAEAERLAKDFGRRGPSTL